MPLGAFIANRQLMSKLTENPILGHITTFGGHPVSCAAGLAALKLLLEENWIQQVKVKEQLLKSRLVHPMIKATRSFGLWMAIEFESFEQNKKIIDSCIEEGLLTDWFLFANNCLRISPPLLINEAQLNTACDKILSICK